MSGEAVGSEDKHKGYIVWFGQFKVSVFTSAFGAREYRAFYKKKYGKKLLITKEEGGVIK
jgi:hypothetical protein